MTNPMKKLLLLLILAAAFLFNSCETDFDVSANWSDITVVYGLFSQNDSVHYVKINKAFLGKGNALEYAKEKDSSSYLGQLDVMIIEKNRAVETRSFVMDTTSIYNKEAGIFYAPEQLVYKAAFKIPSDYSSREYTYHLEIRNRRTGKLVTAQTPLIHDFSIEIPRPGQQSINFTAESNQRIKWYSAKNGRRYNVSIRFWFDEVVGASRDTIARYIDWNFGSEKSSSVQGGESIELSYTPVAFFSVCRSQIPYKPGSEIDENSVVARLVNRVEFLFAVAGDELNTYMEVNEPSAGIVQDKPDYTNINNGIGLFSCRYLKSTESPGVKMKVGPTTEERLIKEDLKFIKKIGN